MVLIAGTDGVVRALDRRTGRTGWTFAAEAEILGTPAWSGAAIVFGSGDGKVRALNRSGTLRWQYDAGAPVYGPPLVAKQAVFVGDNAGCLHALDLESGKARWVFRRADFAIESKPHLWKGMVVFGAWDGYVYAVNASDGTLVWKSLGPKSSEGKAARYYAPADCGPTSLGEALFVCDRGYQCGIYSPDGRLDRKLEVGGVSGIAADPAGSAVLARTFDDRVCRLDARGNKTWETALPAGRFPIPPTVVGSSVYVCSNGGRVAALDFETGREAWAYQATPGFYVMAPLAVDQAGACYVAGMDGSVTALPAVVQAR
jgi:outer membrane protein assembly factor BamB